MARPEREQEPKPTKVPLHLKIRKYKPVAPEEILRRRALFEEAMALRERIGPIGLSTAELIRQDRDKMEEEEQRG